MTTYDCDQSGHYGYAYFVIDCDYKTVSSNSCSSDRVTFTAPDGFSYRWYRSGASATLSSAQTFTTPSAGTYHCDLSFVGAPNDVEHRNCYFTLTAISGVRFPCANFQALPMDTSDCKQSWYRMINQSITTSDVAHNDTLSNGCENYLWVFDDGTTSTNVNPQHGFFPGYHTVKLYSYIGGGSCVDSTTQTFLAVTPCTIIDTVYDSICYGQSYRLFDTVITTIGVYSRDTILENDSILARTLFLTWKQGSTGVFFDTCNSGLAKTEHSHPLGAVQTTHF